MLASKTEEDWNKVGLVVSREEAAPYVILEDEETPELIPILNITSAQLILGADVEPTYVEQDVIEQQTPGETIGIFGAPQTLPRPSRFIDDGWTACTGDERGITLGLQSSPALEAVERGGLVVANQDRAYVVARSGDGSDTDRAHLYPLPAGGDVDAMLNDLGLESTVEATDVPEDWLRLFPAGGELGWTSFGITDATVQAGRPGALPALGPGRRLLGRRGRGAGADPDRADAPDAVRVPGLPQHPDPGEQPGQARQAPSAHRRRAAPGRRDRPDVRRRELAGAGARAAERPPLRTAPDDPRQAYPGWSSCRTRPTSISAENVTDPEQIVYAIEDGRGAFVFTGDWDDESSLTSFVIDPRGTAYSLLNAQTIEKLGYDDAPAALVPDSWVELFAEGVELSTSLALCPPSATQAADQDCRELPS